MANSCGVSAHVLVRRAGYEMGLSPFRSSSHVFFKGKGAIGQLRYGERRKGSEEG